MNAFRFATTVLVGPWRSSREEALHDAVHACQAVRDDSRPDGLEWRVSGRIEEAPGKGNSRRGQSPKPR
jgi:hypothetical protein